MDELTIKRLAYVFAQADGGCSHCAKGLTDAAAEYWPDIPWWEIVKAEMDKPYEERYDEATDEKRVPLLETTNPSERCDRMNELKVAKGHHPYCPLPKEHPGMCAEDTAEYVKHSRRFRGFRPEVPAHYIVGGYGNQPGEAQYEGIVFSDGTVALRWLTQYRSTSVWTSFVEFLAVHGHADYGTVIEWLDR